MVYLGSGCCAHTGLRSSPSDGLVQWLGPKILADQGATALLTDEVAQSLLDSLPLSNFLANKSKKVATTRWGTWHDHVDQLLGEYHAKLFLLLCLGLLHGWSGKDMLGNEAIQQLSKRTATLVPGSSSGSGGAAGSDEQPKESLKMATEKMRRARDGCRNTLAAAAKTMSSPGFHFDLSCISVTTAPLRKWHGDMAKRMKHSCAARAFYAREARFGKDSGLRAVLQEMFNPFWQPRRN